MHRFNLSDVLFFLALEVFLNFFMSFLELGMAPLKSLMVVEQRSDVHVLNFVQNFELFLQHNDFSFQKLIFPFELKDFRALVDLFLNYYLHIL